MHANAQTQRNNVCCCLRVWDSLWCTEWGRVSLAVPPVIVHQVSQPYIVLRHRHSIARSLVPVHIEQAHADVGGVGGGTVASHVVYHQWLNAWTVLMFCAQRCKYVGNLLHMLADAHTSTTTQLVALHGTRGVLECTNFHFSLPHDKYERIRQPSHLPCVVPLLASCLFRTMVELAHGCYHIVCNCGCNWCYKCGNAWSGVEAGCGCLLWDRENVALEETFRTQHYQAHGQDESHARQMAAADLVKYGLAAAAVPPQQLPQAPWTAQSSAGSQPQQQHSRTTSDGSVEFSSIARHLFGPQQPLEHANRFVPPLPFPVLAPQAVAAALGFAPLQQQRSFPAGAQPQNFPFHSLPAEAPRAQDSHASLLQQQQLLAHLRALEASQHPQPLGYPAGLKPAAPNLQLPPGHLPASAAWLAAVENRQASQQQNHQHSPAPAVASNQQTVQPAAQQQSSSSSGRAHHRAQQLVAQQMQAAAWAAHVQAATEHMQYAMYSQQRAQVHASLHAQLQAQMDFDEQQDQQEQQREREQQQKLEAATLPSSHPTPPAPQQQHPAVKQQHPAAQQHTLAREAQSAATHKLPQDADLQQLQRHGTQQFGSPQHKDDNSVGSADADTHHSVASSPTSDSCADGAHGASDPHPHAQSGASMPTSPASPTTAAATGAGSSAGGAAGLVGSDTLIIAHLKVLVGQLLTPGSQSTLLAHQRIHH